MVETTRETGEVLYNSACRVRAQPPAGKRTRQDKPPVWGISEAYDALDYRLMATFPASDATAQY